VEAAAARNWVPFQFLLLDQVSHFWHPLGAGMEEGCLGSQYGQGNKRLALDHCAPEGVHELQSLGLELANGEEVMELARIIKSDDEIVAMRRSIFACERSIELMRNYFKPGISEQELWSRVKMEAV
jgi:Xaa-Pro aminopeptidase